MPLGNMSQVLLLLLVLEMIQSNSPLSSESKTEFHLEGSLMRHARLKCLQRFPQADTVNFNDSDATKCFLHCFLYETGLMNLTTRGLNSEKFIDIWENNEEAFTDDSCLERFSFYEPLNASCNDTYRKLMEFRKNCLEFFDYVFCVNSTWSTDNPAKSKPIGLSATEFCDLREAENEAASENSEEADVPLISRYKDKLKCIFENIHYLDAYGRVDETEIHSSFQEAGENSGESQVIVRVCSRRANSKYQSGYLGNMVAELQKCLKTSSSVYAKVFKIRNEASKRY